MIKFVVMLAAATISYSSVPLLAQQAAAGAQSDATVNAGSSAGGAHISQSSNANASLSANRGDAAAAGDAEAADQANLHPVNGRLLGRLDSKSAKIGDRVVVKTTEAFRTSEGVVVPKGSRLVGHVTEVQAHGNGNQDSRLGIQFDRAELKSGESFMVHSTIESLAPPAGAVAAASIDSSEEMGGSGIGGGMGGGRVVGGGHAGGGLLGGASAVTSTTSGAGSNFGSGLGRTVGATGSLAGSAGASAGNSLNGAAGTTGGLAAHATSVPGVMLAGSATGSASEVLSASKHNVHLDSGTQMTLGIAGAASR